MKAIRVLSRGIRDAFKSVFRNFSLTTAAITCSTITLLLVAVAMIISYNVRSITTDLEKELTIIAYLKQNTSEEEINNLKEEIEKLENVKSVTIKDKDEWKIELKDYDETFKNSLDYFDENPLLDSIVVKVKDVANLKETTEKIRAYDIISSADYGEEAAENIVSAFDIIEKFAVIMVAALVLVTSFLISNTIRLTIFSRRSEIEIMRLVGASNAMVKLPFIFEGLVLGVLGSIIPILITVYGYIILYDHFGGHLLLSLIRLVEPFNFIIYVSLLLLLIGSVIGMIGSYLSVRRYLKI